MARTMARSRERSRQAGNAWAICLLVLIIALGAVLAPPRAAADTASVAGPFDPFADVIPSELGPAEAAAETLSAVTLEAALDPAASTIGGEMAVTWRNPADEPLDEVWFRLFPNAAYYGEGNLAVSDVTVDRLAVTPEWALGETALRVPLPEPVAPGQDVEIALDFTTTIPADSTGSYGIFTRDTGSGAWVLADWFPILAVYEADAGWVLPPVTSFGDPTYAPSAFYEVLLTTPADLAVAATGVVAGEDRTAEAVTRRYVAGPARDFVIVADDDHVAITRQVGETTLSLWTAPDLDPATAEQALDLAAGALEYYNDWLGPYPARDIELAQVDPSGALGIAWAGLLFLDGPALLETYGDHDPDGLATIVAHEMAHLWWGILVGGDSNAHGYVQEGLATVTSLLYMESAFGPEVATAELDAWVIGPARRLLGAGDAVVDVPVADGQDETMRSDATYGKGTLGFLAIRQAIGAEAFAAALRDAATRYAWREMTPAELRAAFERASGQDLSALWQRWFDEAAMTQEEIDTLAGVFS